MSRILNTGFGVPVLTGVGYLQKGMIFMHRAGAPLCCEKWHVWGAGGPLFETGEFLFLV